MHIICPPPPPQILHNLCFSFLLGITVVQREIENNAYAKFWGQIRCIITGNWKWRIVNFKNMPFSFLLVLQPSQEKLKTMLTQNFGGRIRCIMGNVEVAYCEL